MSKSKSDSSLLVGLFLGLVQGILLGLIFAPKSGQETNRDVNRFVSTLPQQFSDEYPESLAVFKRARITVENGFSKVKRALVADKVAAAKKREELAGVAVNGIEN